MGKRSRSRDRRDKDRDHKKDKKKSRSRERSKDKDRHKEPRSHHDEERKRSRDRRDTHHRDYRDTRDNRDTRDFSNRFSGGGGFGGGWGHGTTTGSSAGEANYAEFVKKIAEKKKEKDNWANAPDNLNIKDDNGEINEELLKTVQSNSNMDRQIQRELGEKFNEKLKDAKTIVPKIDQTDLENRNRFLGSADPYELQMYGHAIPAQATTMTDKAKLMRKIYIPKNNNFNYTGFIIGPRGSNQKRLEEETKCKILLRGKGSQKEGSSVQNYQKD